MLQCLRCLVLRRVVIDVAVSVVTGAATCGD